MMSPNYGMPPPPPSLVSHPQQIINPIQVGYVTQPQMVQQIGYQTPQMQHYQIHNPGMLIGQAYNDWSSPSLAQYNMYNMGYQGQQNTGLLESQGHIQQYPYNYSTYAENPNTLAPMNSLYQQTQQPDQTGVENGLYGFEQQEHQQSDYNYSQMIPQLDQNSQQNSKMNSNTNLIDSNNGHISPPNLRKRGQNSFNNQNSPDHDQKKINVLVENFNQEVKSENSTPFGESILKIGHIWKDNW